MVRRKRIMRADFSFLMSRTHRRTAAVIAALIALSSGMVARAGAPPPAFKLGRFVPNSCFCYVHRSANPKSAQIERHWEGVWEALQQVDLSDAIGRALSAEMADADRAEFQLQWDHIIDLGRQVAWQDMIKREFVIAGSLDPYPSAMLLCLGKPGSARKNLPVLLDLLRYTASMSEIAVFRVGRSGKSKLWTLDFENTPLSLHVFVRGDLIGITTSKILARRTMKLMSGHSPGRSITQTDKYQRAVSDLPVPEDEIAYIDFEVFAAGLGKLVETATGRSMDGAPERPGLTLVAEVIDRLNVLDYTVIVQRTEGDQQFAHMVTSLREDRLDSPVSRIFSKRPTLNRPLQVVPVEAFGFAAGSGVDFKAAYAAILGFVGEEVPGGAELLEGWAEFQTEVGFHLREDLLEWISGEYLTISLPAVHKPLLLDGDGVLLMTVTDPKLAKEKLQSGLEKLRELAMQHLGQTVLISDAPGVKGGGFKKLLIPPLMMFGQPVIGIYGQTLIVATSESAINKCIETAAGRSPSISDSPRFKAEGLPIEGPVHAASFTDMGKTTQAAGAGIAAAALIGMMKDTNSSERAVAALSGLIAQMVPVLSQIDFFSSSASKTTFDGLTWRTEMVVTYRAD